MNRLLLISYEFPPKGGVAVQRVLKTARYLAESGWDVTVLTVADPPTSLRDESLLDELPKSVRVERAWSLEPTRLLQALRPDGTNSDTPETEVTRGYSQLPRGVIRFVQSFFIPDEKQWWAPWAVRLGKRLHREAPFDVILASGPPFTALGIARRLSRSLDVPWVADLRDPIVGGCFFHPLTPLHGALMRGFERRVLRSAQRVVTVTDQMARDIEARHPSIRGRVVTIPNGYDPEEFASTEPVAPDGFIISHVGTFQGDRTVDALLAGFSAARTVDAQFAAEARVHLVGALDADTTRAVSESAVGDVLTRVGFVTHRQAIAEMRRATVLVLVLGMGRGEEVNLTGKLPEYMAAGRPILALVPEGVAADVVRRYGAGWVVRPDDVEGVAAALREAHAAWRDGSLPVPNREVVAEFDRRSLVRTMGELLEDAISSSS